MNLTVFDSFFNRIWENRSNFDVNIYENEDEYYIEAYLAGIPKNNIYLSYQNNELTIEVRNEQKNEQEAIRKEFYSYVEKRTFNIPNVVEQKAKSKYDNGKLMIKLPKTKDKITSKSHIEID